MKDDSRKEIRRSRYGFLIAPDLKFCKDSTRLDKD